VIGTRWVSKLYGPICVVAEHARPHGNLYECLPDSGLRTHYCMVAGWPHDNVPEVSIPTKPASRWLDPGSAPVGRAMPVCRQGSALAPDRRCRHAAATADGFCAYHNDPPLGADRAAAVTLPPSALTPVPRSGEMPPRVGTMVLLLFCDLHGFKLACVGRKPRGSRVYKVRPYTDSDAAPRSAEWVCV
jgi:hypothetical protein